MDNLKQIYTDKANKDLAEQKHSELVNSSLKLSNTVIDSTMALIKYLEGSTSKVKVVNQLEKIGTPDAFKVVAAIQSLHGTLKTHKNTDLTEITSIMRDVLKQAEMIPKEHAPEKEEKFIDYTQQLTSLRDVISSVEKAVKAQKLDVKAPIVNVDKPDLAPLQKSLQNIVTSVKSIDIPKPESPYTKNKKSVKVELVGDMVPTTTNNLLEGVKFDKWVAIYDDFDENNDKPVGYKYYFNKKIVAQTKFVWKGNRCLSGERTK